MAKLTLHHAVVTFVLAEGDALVPMLPVTVSGEEWAKFAADGLDSAIKDVRKVRAAQRKAEADG